jgi:hypothetical protein
MAQMIVINGTLFNPINLLLDMFVSYFHDINLCLIPDSFNSIYIQFTGLGQTHMLKELQILKLSSYSE